MYSIATDYEVAVVGGGVAGLSAAMMLGRARVKVCVIGDAAATLYRGRTHNFLTNDGATKQEILAKGQAELGQYPSIEQRVGRVVEITRDALSYELTLADGSELSARRLILALGLSYPAGSTGIDGFDERFGQDIFTCPYCHGYELSERRIVLIGSSERDADFLRLLSNWSPDLHYIAHNGPPGRTMAPILDQVADGSCVEGQVEAIVGDPGRPVAILQDGQRIEADAFFIADLPDTTSWPIIDALGIERGLHPLIKKPVYKTDAAGRTDLKDVFIIGDARSGFSTLAGAAHEGVIAGFMMTNDIIEARTKSSARPAA
jgi:thioredoxin reductase